MTLALPPMTCAPQGLLDGGGTRPATAAEIAGGGADCVVTAREKDDFRLQVKFQRFLRNADP
jgi:hypothetical protein